MKSVFVTLTVIFIWQLQDAAEVCFCPHIDPLKALCNSDVVFKARVTGRSVVDQNLVTTIRFDIRVLQVFKGPQFIDAVYTSDPCRAFLNTNGGPPYLITGQLEADGTVHITACNFIRQWDALTDDELRLIQNYQNYCG